MAKQKGRPPGYSEALADRICDEIAQGKSLNSICEADDMPNPSTIYRWLGDVRHVEFCKRYACAKDDQAEGMFEEITRIRDQVASGVLGANEARVIIDAIKWQAGKLKPQKYSDKYVHEVSGPNGGPIEYTDTERAARLASLLDKAAKRESEG